MHGFFVVAKKGAPETHNLVCPFAGEGILTLIGRQHRQEYVFVFCYSLKLEYGTSNFRFQTLILKVIAKSSFCQHYIASRNSQVRYRKLTSITIIRSVFGSYRYLYFIKVGMYCTFESDR